MTQQIKTISFKGKPYVEVAERVKQVHSLNQEFQVLESEPLDIVGRVVWRVTISVNGKIYKGSAEAKLTNAKPNSADDTNPFECAETSALGRALAFAGFGTVDGIASYDEIARGQSAEQLAQAQTPPPASRSNSGKREPRKIVPDVKKQENELEPTIEPEPVQPHLVSSAKLNEIYSKGKRAGLYLNAGEFVVFCQLVLGLDILTDAKTLTDAQANDIDAEIVQRAQQAS